MTVCRALALFLLLPALQTDPAEKVYRRMLKLMDQGYYVEGRQVALYILQNYPRSEWADKARPYTEENAFCRIVPIEVNGPASNRLDVVVMADGVEWDNRRQGKWEKEGDGLLKFLFTVEPFVEYARCFNLYRAHVASWENRLNQSDGPRITYFRALADEGQLVVDGFAAREVARRSGAEEALALVQVRPGEPMHGFSARGVAVVGSARPEPEDIPHAFGHSFAGLADERSRRGRWWGGRGGGDDREPPPLPAAPNVSDTDHPELVPWKHWIAASRSGDRRAEKVGIFEGAGWREKGAWRPAAAIDCLMNEGKEFCPVCREAVVLLIYTYVRPIDEATPWEKPITLGSGEKVDLWVLPIQPVRHKLSIEWILERLPVEGAVEPGQDATSRRDDETVSIQDLLRCEMGMPGPRKGEGPTWKPPGGEMVAGTVRHDGEAVGEVFSVDGTKLGRGRYRITAVVRDTTEWVLRDAENLLVDWRSWSVVVE